MKLPHRIAYRAAITKYGTHTLLTFSVLSYSSHDNWVVLSVCSSPYACYSGMKGEEEGSANGGMQCNQNHDEVLPMPQ